jgi:glycosyltransferase involved in cell wall biosynthesis
MKELFLTVIPAYNEEKSLGRLLLNLSKFVSLKNVLVVDDGSDDNTAVIAEKAGSRILRQKTNQGKGLALKAGFDFAVTNGYEAVITMDADGQHDPKEISKFLSYYEKYNNDFIIGTRKYNPSEMPAIRLQVNKVTSFIASLLSGIRIHDSQSGYRLIRKNIIKKIELKTNRFQMETEIIVKAARAGFSIGEVPIKTIYLSQFKSHINPFTDTIRFIKLILRLLCL